MYINTTDINLVGKLQKVFCLCGVCPWPVLCDTLEEDTWRYALEALSSQLLKPWHLARMRHAASLLVSSIFSVFCLIFVDSVVIIISASLKFEDLV